MQMARPPTKAATAATQPQPPSQRWRPASFPALAHDPPARPKSKPGSPVSRTTKPMRICLPSFLSFPLSLSPPSLFFCSSAKPKKVDTCVGTLDCSKPRCTSSRALDGLTTSSAVATRCKACASSSWPVQSLNVWDTKACTSSIPESGPLFVCEGQ